MSRLTPLTLRKVLWPTWALALAGAATLAIVSCDKSGPYSPKSVDPPPMIPIQGRPIKRPRANGSLPGTLKSRTEEDHADFLNQDPPKEAPREA